MVREILFRAKRIDNGEWERGYYAFINGKHCIVSQSMGEIVEIHIETLGQYTGLDDRNGVKIFETDIVQASAGGKFIVEWEDDCTRFALVGLGTSRVEDDFESIWDFNLEVVG